jgi:hypothetical protein
LSFSFYHFSFRVLVSLYLTVMNTFSWFITVGQCFLYQVWLQASIIYCAVILSILWLWFFSSSLCFFYDLFYDFLPPFSLCFTFPFLSIPFFSRIQVNLLFATEKPTKALESMIHKAVKTKLRMIYLKVKENPFQNIVNCQIFLGWQNS